MKNQYAKKKDGNHNLIAGALQRAGYKPFDCSKFGRGFPDLICESKSGYIVLIEIKDVGGEMTDAEAAFFYCYNEAKNLFVVRSPEQALQVMYEFDQVTK